jgi:hypothetical protein
MSGESLYQAKLGRHTRIDQQAKMQSIDRQK